MTESLQRFAFDTVFEGDHHAAELAPRTKRYYGAHEVEVIRQEALAEGERRARTSAEGELAAALQAVAAAVGEAMPSLAACAHAHREGAAELALAAGRVIAGAALEHAPTAPIQAALASLSREVEAAPRLTVRVSEAVAAGVEAALARTADACGFSGQISVKTDPSLSPAAFSFDWGEGRAAFDPEAAAARVAEALHQALAAEGLHAEPLTPATEARHV